MWKEIIEIGTNLFAIIGLITFCGLVILMVLALTTKVTPDEEFDEFENDLIRSIRRQIDEEENGNQIFMQ